RCDRATRRLLRESGAVVTVRLVDCFAGAMEDRRTDINKVFDDGADRAGSAHPTRQGTAPAPRARAALLPDEDQRWNWTGPAFRAICSSRAIRCAIGG